MNTLNYLFRISFFSDWRRRLTLPFTDSCRDIPLPAAAFDVGENVLSCVSHIIPQIFCISVTRVFEMVI